MTNTNIENTDEACKVDNRQVIAQALQKDMPVKTNDNRLFIDNAERYAHDRQAISYLLNDIHTPDNSDQSEDSDSEVVITSKDRRHINTGPDMKRKQMTKDRQQALAEAQ